MNRFLERHVFQTKLKCIPLLMLFHCVVFVASESYYSILAPGVIKSNRKYTVVLTLHASTTPCDIRITITGSAFNASDEVSLQPFETKKLDFFPPKLETFDYKLLAEGMNGCQFRNQTDLLIDESSGPKIYIQTDKSIYKPLDLVQFRVVILDEHTRPVNIREPIRVEILDRAGNRVKQFKDIALTRGVFTDKFKLSQQPLLGYWQIKVSISGKYSHQNSKYFTVNSYTLPKFSTYMEVPENVVLDDPKIRAEIYGKYTFDKYVEGKLYVELYTNKNNKNYLIEQETLQIDGLAIVELQIRDTRKLSGVKSLNLIAIIQENHTGISRSISKTINVRQERYCISIPLEEIEFRNNKPFRLKAYVKDWINGPVRDSHSNVVLEHGYKSYKTFLDDEGKSSFEFEYVENSSFTVIYKGSMEVLPAFQVYKESGEIFYCKLKVIGSPRLGKPVEIEVKSSFNIPYLVLTVVGHGSIIQQEYVALSGNKNTHVIKLIPSIEMVPVSFVYVHYIQNGNFRYDELQLKFPMELENIISVEAPKQVKPGQEVVLKIKAEPNSYVSVLAVDISVFLLDSKYDIYKQTILNDLNLDRTYIVDGYIIRPGIISGVVTLTNAHYPVKIDDRVPVEAERVGPWDFRTKFPETWIFNNYFINKTETEIKYTIPDTVTTWRLTAFSNHAIKGFGVVDGPTDITTFLPFFISPTLPYQVKRDESVILPITVFNYHNQSLKTEVTIFNNYKQFQFIESLSEFPGGFYQTKCIEIPENGGKTVKFHIKPVIAGQLKLYISANNSVYADGILQLLKVVPEGVTKYENLARYLSATDNNTTFTINIPQNAVTESEVITLMVGGDFMVPSLENLNELVKLPTGCGEQNMVNLAPNILILEYLKATGMLSKEKRLAKEAKSYIEIGYQQQVSYRHTQGGYSVFGDHNNDDTSNWLTAYVTRFLIKASRYSSVESRIIDLDLEFLAKQQERDGSFPYTGYLFYKELQNRYSLTAYILLTFMEDRRYARKYKTTIRSGLDYISSNLDDINDAYDISLVAAALSKAKHVSHSKALSKLQNYRKEDEDGLTWWSSNGNDVETTAYVLLALLDAPGNHLPILKWLIKQRNSQGGFKSTHDTVVGLEALVKYAQKYNNASSWNMKISYTAHDHEGNVVESNNFSVDEANTLILQQHELARSVRHVNFQTTGDGYSLAQVSFQYNIRKDEELLYFTIEASPFVDNAKVLDLGICFTYHALKTVHNSSNMVIMEANLPSGFKLDAEISRDLLENNNFIQRTETKNDETTMVLYFDKLSAEVKHCITLEAYLATEVEDHKPSSINMFDYYNTDRFTSLFYEIKLSN